MGRSGSVRGRLSAGRNNYTKLLHLEQGRSKKNVFAMLTFQATAQASVHQNVFPWRQNTKSEALWVLVAFIIRHLRQHEQKAKYFRNASYNDGDRRLPIIDALFGMFLQVVGRHIQGTSSELKKKRRYCLTFAACLTGYCDTITRTSYLSVTRQTAF